MMYAPAPPESTDDSDIHADSEDVVDIATAVIQEEPVEQQEVEEKMEQVAMSQEAQVANDLASNHLEERRRAGQQEVQRKSSSRVLTVLWLTVCCVILTLILAAAVLIVLYETNHIPTLDPLRHNRSVRDFREAYYVPVRAWIEGGLGQIRLAYQRLPSFEELKERVGIGKDTGDVTNGQ